MCRLRFSLRFLGLFVGTVLVMGAGLMTLPRKLSTTNTASLTIYPNVGSVDVYPGGPFYIDFNGPLPARPSFSLVDGEGVPIKFRASPGVEGQSVYLEPQTPLKWDERYKLCVKSSQALFLNSIRFPRQECADFRTMSKPEVSGHPDAPILVVQGADRPFSRYYSAILEAEGLNAFATIPEEDLTAPVISDRSVIIFDSAGLPNRSDVDLLDWVERGGLLILMRPENKLRRIFGLSESAKGPFSFAKITTDKQSSITSGLPSSPLPVYGPIDRIPDVTDSPSAVTTLVRVMTGKTPFQVQSGNQAHAVEMTGVGQGHIVSFAFDLSRSIVFTRQGNPVLVDEERDQSDPVRPNDLFSPDLMQLDSAVVPVADELQRLLVNIIAERAPLPLPRLWYLPDMRRAALVMAADDHRTDGGTLDHFATMDNMSPPDCDLDGWECLRASSYLSPGTILTQDDAKLFSDKGFEIGVHVDTSCEVPDSRSKLFALIRNQIKDFRAEYPDLPEQQTHRIHCIIWKGWIDVPLAQREMGIRLDLNYYHWSPDWLKGRQIFMTGSGFPMPFARRDGSILDVYQAATHLVNENGVPHDEGIISKLDRALGPEQYFGAFVTHYDFSKGYAPRLIELARQRGVAMITSQQLLTWLDGRNASSFETLAWDGSTLNFKIQLDEGARHAYAALPARFRDRTISRVTCGEPLHLTTEEIKGIRWAFFPATPGVCSATYEQVSS